jgi:hypothetical protein
MNLPGLHFEYRLQKLRSEVSFGFMGRPFEFCQGLFFGGMADIHLLCITAV